VATRFEGLRRSAATLLLAQYVCTIVYARRGHPTIALTLDTYYYDLDGMPTRGRDEARRDSGGLIAATSWLHPNRNGHDFDRLCLTACYGTSGFIAV